MPNDQWENEISRDPAFELLQRMGYAALSNEDCRLQRGTQYNVLLKDVLRGQLRRLNRYSYGGTENEFSAANIERAITELESPITEGLVKSSEKIYDVLLLGKSYPEFVGEGKTQHFDFRFIDWENPENNVFHVTREFSVESQDGRLNPRVDIVAFVNGIPFAAIECKNPSIPHIAAIDQHLRNQKPEYIPHFYRFTQILIATNKNSISYATTNTPKEFWSNWKEEDESFLNSELERLVPDRTPTQQDKTLISLLTPARALELIRFFILFDSNVKKICRYQQFFAVHAIYNTINQTDANGNRQGGVVWHTQGSGKSLTMVMLAKYLLMKLPDNPRVVVVTDRKELDKQIARTFNNSRLKSARAESGRGLANLLKENHSDVITALINKFSWVEQNAVISPSRNVFILVDESHRSNYGLLATKMRTVFPNGCYIGFTGTPLMTSEKNTMAKFGRLIHQYTILAGVNDKAVLPLIYEGRFVEQTVDKTSIDIWFEQTTSNLTDEQKNDLKRKWSSLERLTSASERIRRISLDIYNHFNSNVRHTGFKAMLATNFKRDAVRYLKCFESLGGLRCAVVISQPDMRENPDEDSDDKLVHDFWSQMMDLYGNEDKYESEIKDKFIDGEIDILIVCSKLLTGFDAPRCQVLYIDKDLKEHGLLQAIARTNRLFEGKEYGLIIDYRCLLQQLDDALEKYSGAGLEQFDAHDLKGVAVDINSAIPQLREAYTRLDDLLSGASDKQDEEAVEIFLADEDKRKDFYKLVCRFGQKLATVFNSPRAYNSIPRDELEKYKKVFQFCSKIRRSVKIRYCDAIDNSEYESIMQNLLDTYMSVAGLKRITNPVNIFNREEFDSELSQLGSPRAKADAIVHTLNKNIHDRYDENPAFYESFSKRIEQVLSKFKNRIISDLEYLAGMRNILADFYAGKSNIQYPDRIKNDPHAQAFYGVITSIFSNDVQQNISPEQSAEISERIAKIIGDQCHVDWTNNQTVHNRIKQEIDDLLYEYEDAGQDISAEVHDKIIDNVLAVALRRF